MIPVWLDEYASDLRTYFGLVKTDEPRGFEVECRMCGKRFVPTELRSVFIMHLYIARKEHEKYLRECATL